MAVGPRILEGHDLGGGILAFVLFEEEIVVAGGVERRIEIDEIGDFVWDRLIHAFAPEPDKIIAVVELIDEVGGHGMIIAANDSNGKPSPTRFYVEANAASGGGDTTTSHTFDNLLPTNHKFYGAMDMQSWRNMEELVVGVDHQIDAKLGAKLHWHKFALRDASDGWYGAGGGINRGALGLFIDPTGASGKNIGSEIDFELNYKLNPRTSFSGGIGVFSPGSFINARNGGVADQQTWFYLMGQIRF